MFVSPQLLVHSLINLLVRFSFGLIVSYLSCKFVDSFFSFFHGFIFDFALTF